jgi:hypothetical protein
VIVVKIELHSAITGGVTEIGRMLIGNVGGTVDQGEYDVKVLRRRDTPVSCDPAFDDWDDASVTREGTVKRYPRLSHNVWRLVVRALLSAFPEEK